MWSIVAKFITDKIGVGNLIIGAIIFTIVGLAVWHYNNLTNEVNQLRHDKANLESTVQIQQATVDKAVSTINEWKQSMENLTTTVQQMQRVSEDANKELKKLNQVYSKHNLDKLSLQKPELIENAINRGTADSMRLLRCSSGAKDCDNGTR